MESIDLVIPLSHKNVCSKNKLSVNKKKRCMYRKFLFICKCKYIAELKDQEAILLVKSLKPSNFAIYMDLKKIALPNLDLFLQGHHIFFFDNKFQIIKSEPLEY